MVEWQFSDGLIEYDGAVAKMEQRVLAIQSAQAEECIWLLEHPALITAGTSAKPFDLLQPDRFPLFQSNRGGQFTYHGPGQRVGYVMLDLNRRGKDIRKFVWLIEEWLIMAFAEFSLKVQRAEGRIGLWVGQGDQELKIAAIGLRVRKWVSFHGFSVNIEPDLEHFSSIVPCGNDRQKFGVTSMVELGYPISMTDFDTALVNTFKRVFS